MGLSYIDTSALAKWYLPEAGSDAFADWMQEQDEACISTLTKIEFRCLLARRHRMQLLTSLQVQEVYAKFQQDCQDGHLLHYEMSDRHVLSAELMIEGLPSIALRTLDALHLSIAHEISARVLATADKLMAQAGQLLEMRVIWFGKQSDVSVHEHNDPKILS